MYDERKIKNELHDLDFVVDQIGKIYCELTGGLLSKPMYHAETILEEHNERFLSKAITQDDLRGIIDNAKTKDDLIAELKDYFEF